MPKSTRRVSTEKWKSDYFENPETMLDDMLVFDYLHTSDQVEICGFYRLSLSRAAAETHITPERFAEILKRMQSFGMIVWDEGYLWIPRFFESQSSTKFKPAIRNINNQHRDFTGQGDNLAFLAFCDHFEDELATDQQDTKLKIPKKSLTKPHPSSQTEVAPTLAQVREIFDTFTISGRKHPDPDIESEAAFRYYNEHGWSANWAERIKKWIERDNKNNPFPNRVVLSDGREIIERYGS